MDEVWRIFWNRDENVFYDVHGYVIVNIFEFLTPNDIYLFRQDHGYCMFPVRFGRKIMCEIMTDE